MRGRRILFVVALFMYEDTFALMYLIHRWNILSYMRAHESIENLGMQSQIEFEVNQVVGNN